MSTKVTVVPATKADVPVIAKLIHASKLSLTINRLLYKDWPNDSVQRSNCISALENGLKSPSTQNFKAVDEGGEILGYVAFTRKRPAANASPDPSKEGADKGAAAPSVPDYFESSVLTAVMEAVSELNAVMDKEDHLYVTFIVVEQSRRGKGVGSQLLRAGLENAKAEGVPVTINCEPAAHGFFHKMGFHDTKHFEMDLSKWAPPYTGFGPFRLFGMVWYP